MAATVAAAGRAGRRPRRLRAEGAAPIVVIGTTRDPATPYAWAVALADQLESGVLVTYEGDGHTGYTTATPASTPRSTTT